MVLEFTRVDYALLGLAANNCMKLLPHSPLKGVQKVAFGGSDGVVQAFSIKKGELQVAFKTLPGEPISSLELGGATGGVKDKIFVSCKNEVRGYSKKGKLFLGFDTNLTEPIKSMYVSRSDLLVAGTHVFNHYKDCKDVNSYLSSDTINHVIALNSEKTHRLTTVLACEDRVLRVLERGNLTQTIPLPSVPVNLCLFHNNGGPSGDLVVYALQNGQIGMIQISRATHSWKWVIENTKNRDAVRCMYWYDLTKEGSKELIVGRDDGSIQVYSEPLERLADTDPLMEVYNYVCNESITSIQAGNVGNPAFDEIVATTYTGWLFGLTTEVLEKQVSLDTTKNAAVSVKFSPEEKMKIDRLRSEIEDIERTVVKERERYQMSTQEDSIGISTIPELSISDKLTLLRDESVFQLTIEAETAIDNVLLQSDVSIKLIDVEKNSAVVSHSYCDPQTDNKLLATYRCQVNTSKLSILMQFGREIGTLNIYITPHAQPKATHIRSYPIRQLSLNTRIHNFDDTRPVNVLTLKGGFSFAEMHHWISHCLPEIPEKIPTNDNAIYFFESSFIGTTLQCKYRKGEAEFKSDDVSTISVLKDFLTKEATMKKIQLDISFVLNDETIYNTLTLLYPKLEKAMTIQKQARLLEALKDIEIGENESGLTFIPECLKVIENQHEIQKDLNQQWQNLERIQDTVITLFMDWYRFKNINARTKINNLKEALSQNCTFDYLIEFFDASSAGGSEL
uniref:Uncharacterized protein n=4 Tax=Lygus hesperus TaxID=30085 RepID=A0A0K8T3A0_LYGHE